MKHVFRSETESEYFKTTHRSLTCLYSEHKRHTIQANCLSSPTTKFNISHMWKINHLFTRGKQAKQPRMTL